MPLHRLKSPLRRNLKRAVFSARMPQMSQPKPSCPVFKITAPPQLEDMPHQSRDELREALFATAERYRAILDTAVTGIITMDENCIIDGVNAAAERMFGYTREEMIGQNVSMLMPYAYQGKHNGFVQKYIRTGEAQIIGTIGRELVARRKDGTEFPIDASVGEVNLPQGRLFTGIIRDISDRVQLEEKILEISEQEQHRIGQDIHDDLCQQLAAIGCLAKVALQNLEKTNHPETESLAEIVHLVTSANARAREMSRGLVPVVLDSGGLMQALEELARSSSRIFRISCHFECNPPVSVHDNKMATQLYRIAQEAVGNAIKHSQADYIEIALGTEGEALILTIRDNGNGIPEHALKQLDGLGLLTMSHRAKMIGGTVNFKPEPQGGTVVVCELPHFKKTLVEV